MLTAFQIPGLKWSLISGGAIPRFRFVSVNSTGAAVLANASSTVIGTSQNETKTGEVQEIIDGLVMVEAAATITAGTKAVSDANGKAVTSDDTDGFVVITGGEAGDLVTLKV